MGFEGLVVTDSLDMGGVALHYALGTSDDNRLNIAANAALRDQAGKASANAAQDIASLAQLKNAPVMVQKVQLLAASYVASFAAKKVEERREMAAVEPDVFSQSHALGVIVEPGVAGLAQHAAEAAQVHWDPRGRCVVQTATTMPDRTALTPCSSSRSPT